MNYQGFTDQLNREVPIPYPPKRIISLVPSQTELLFDLGLDDETVGITKFCVHPRDKVRSKAKIGGTKKLNLEKIKQLKPDLIIGNVEENDKAQIELLMKEFAVWMSDIYTLEDALIMIEQVGNITGKKHKAKSIKQKITNEFNSLSITTSNLIPDTSPSLRIAYFIWQNPYMVAGTNTFIDNMIHSAGWENAFSILRYPEISIEQLKSANPDIIFLSSEPYPFKEKHLAEFRYQFPGKAVYIVDGELFSWYGSRLQYAPAYFRHLRKELKKYSHELHE